MRHNIDILNTYALNNNGKCLSTLYINNSSKYLFECENGHNWETTANRIQQGYWCPICAGNVKHDLLWLNELALNKNGKCLSEKYVNVDSKYEWNCNKCNHIWFASASSIRRGTWCPKCAGKLITIDDLHKIAFKNNGICLSEKYFTIKDNYHWKCENGHEWFASFDNVKKNTWCPKCRISKGENEIIKFLVKNNIIFNKEHKFSECKNQRLLPFDFYLPDFNICIEYDGIQHYKETTGKWKNKLKKIQVNDNIKTEFCEKMNIKLCRISYLNFNNIEKILSEILIKSNI